MKPEKFEIRSIYVLTADEQSVKIGVSIDPGQRARQIQVGQDRDIRVYWATIMWKPYAYKVEQGVHNRLRGKLSHIRGEWYLFNPAQAVAEIKNQIKAMGYNSTPDPDYGFGERA